MPFSLRFVKRLLAKIGYGLPGDHGLDVVLVHAAMRADAMLEKGDLDGYAAR